MAEAMTRCSYRNPDDTNTISVASMSIERPSRIPVRRPSSCSRDSSNSTPVPYTPIRDKLSLLEYDLEQTKQEVFSMKQQHEETKMELGSVKNDHELMKQKYDETKAELYSMKQTQDVLKATIDGLGLHNEGRDEVDGLGLPLTPESPKDNKNPFIKKPLVPQSDGDDHTSVKQLIETESDSDEPTHVKQPAEMEEVRIPNTPRPRQTPTHGGMTEEHKSKLIHYRTDLIRELDIEHTLLVDYLLQHRIITRPDMEDIMLPCKTPTDKIRTLIDLLPKRGGRAYGVFIEGVRREQPWIAEKLEPSGLRVVEIEHVFPIQAKEQTIEAIYRLLDNLQGPNQVQLILRTVEVPRIQRGSIVYTLKFKSVEELDEYWACMNNEKLYKRLTRRLLDIVMNDELRELTAGSELQLKAGPGFSFEEYMHKRGILAKGRRLKVREDDAADYKRRRTPYSSEDVLHTLVDRIPALPVIRYRQYLRRRKSAQAAQYESQRKRTSEKDNQLLSIHVENEMRLENKVKECEGVICDLHNQVHELQNKLSDEKSFSKRYKEQKEVAEESAKSAMERMKTLEQHVEEEMVKSENRKNTIGLMKAHFENKECRAKRTIDEKDRQIQWYFL